MYVNTTFIHLLMAKIIYDNFHFMKTIPNCGLMPLILYCMDVNLSSSKGKEQENLHCCNCYCLFVDSLACWLVISSACCLVGSLATKLCLLSAQPCLFSTSFQINRWARQAMMASLFIIDVFGRLLHEKE